MQGCFENSNMQWEKLEKLRKVKWWKVNMRYVPIYLRQGLVILSLTSGTFLLHWLPLLGSSWRIGRGRVCNLTPHLLGCLYRSVVVGSWLGDVASAFSCVFGPDLMLTIEHYSFLGRNGNFSSLPLMLKRISPVPTSMCAPAVLKNGRPRMSGVSFAISMSSTTKSTGVK